MNTGVYIMATKVVSFRVSQKFYELILEYCKKHGYINIADFIRDTIREKIEKEN